MALFVGGREAQDVVQHRHWSEPHVRPEALRKWVRQAVAFASSLPARD